MVLLLHRPEYYDPNDQPGIAELIVAKNRNGRTDTVKLTFLQELHAVREPRRRRRRPDRRRDVLRSRAGRASSPRLSVPVPEVRTRRRPCRAGRAAPGLPALLRRRRSSAGRCTSQAGQAITRPDSAREARPIARLRGLVSESDEMPAGPDGAAHEVAVGPEDPSPLAVDPDGPAGVEAFGEDEALAARRRGDDRTSPGSSRAITAVARRPEAERHLLIEQDDRGRVDPVEVGCGSALARAWLTSRARGRAPASGSAVVPMLRPTEATRRRRRRAVVEPSAGRQADVAVDEAPAVEHPEVVVGHQARPEGDPGRRVAGRVGMAGGQDRRDSSACRGRGRSCRRRRRRPRSGRPAPPGHTADPGPPPPPGPRPPPPARPRRSDDPSPACCVPSQDTGSRFAAITIASEPSGGRASGQSRRQADPAPEGPEVGDRQGHQDRRRQVPQHDEPRRHPEQVEPREPADQARRTASSRRSPARGSGPPAPEPTPPAPSGRADGTAAGPRATRTGDGRPVVDAVLLDPGVERAGRRPEFEARHQLLGRRERPAPR